MPNRPLRLCSNPGCSELTDKSYCLKHTRKFDQKRGSSYDRGYDGRWRKYRILFLREHPLCEICLNECKITQANVVDHIEPHKGNKQLFWDEGNHQALCKACHDRKTATEDGGFRNYKGKTSTA